MSTKPDYIIAIGASAGGMEEIISFFDHTPADNVSYVIIQHLSADFKSRMVELLAKHSKLHVVQAEHGMSVICNQVYLIPNDKFMTIRDGSLYLTGKEEVKAPHLTINTFFNALAEDYGAKAIAIVLSGLGSDGSEGIVAIKKAKGMVMARSPEHTQYDSMPFKAIATGMVDFVMEPALMPAAIEDYIKHEELLLSFNRKDEQNIEAIIAFIKEKSPLDFSDYKLTTIIRRTKRRAAQNNFTTLGSYFEFLKTSPKEVETLAKDFLISVTSFFRDQEAFDYIRKKILPDILSKLVPGEELKMWIAGCATGEEVYSMAILIAEQLTGKLKDTVVKLFATDIDAEAMRHAGKGVYSQNVINAVDPELVEKYFTKEGNGYKVTSTIRKMVIFARHDLVKNPPYCNMHFISCRNLLIYMTPILQKKIFTMFLFGLKKEGYLFLGSSENPGPIIQNLRTVSKKWKLYQNMTTKRGVSFDTFSLPELLDTKSAPTTYLRGETINHKNQNLSEAMHISLATELDYLAICIDENCQVVRSYGDTSKYLLQQNFNSNLVSLLPNPLAKVFNTLYHASLKTKEKVTVNAIKVRRGESTIRINLSVSPLVFQKGAQMLHLITFSEDKSAVSVAEEAVVFDEKVYHDQYTMNLEEELKELKEKLNSAYEKLDASNENMQSFNEELISSNEEMQSTNEEMQSVNEELHTINADYQLKNKELVEINDDLNNYFRSNINGQLFIDNDLLLMKFSPGTVKQINLLETDIGRPLSNISTNIKFETIIDDIKEVLTAGVIITKEIETNNGKWYQIMTMPYIKQAENRNSGAIITFNDITELKRTQQELDKKNKSLLRINADLDNFIHAASHDLLSPLSSIELSIGVMNRRVTDPELSKFLDIINSSIRKFSMLVNDIAIIAKVESDMITLEMIDIEEILDNIEWSLDDKIKASGAIIIRNLNVKKVLFSKKNLRSILYNLISNAIKFKSTARPEINVHTLVSDDNVLLSVQDNGIGIQKRDLDKIFDMYGRLHQDVEGHGIGLYLAKKIVDAASGNIIVESEPGKGSKFMIYFKDIEILS